MPIIVPNKFIKFYSCNKHIHQPIWWCILYIFQSIVHIISIPKRLSIVDYIQKSSWDKKRNLNKNRFHHTWNENILQAAKIEFTKIIHKIIIWPICMTIWCFIYNILVKANMNWIMKNCVNTYFDYRSYICMSFYKFVETPCFKANISQ